MQEPLPGGDEGNICKVLGAYGFPCCQGMVAWHEHAPHVLGRQAQILVAAHVNWLDENAKIRKAPVQTLAHIVAIAAEDVEGKPRVPLGSLAGSKCNIAHGPGLAAGYEDLSCHLASLAKGLPGPFHELKDFPRPLLQKLPLFREGDVTPAAQKKLRAKLLLEVLHLPRERRLGHVEAPCCSADGLVAHDGQKEIERMYVHGIDLHSFGAFFGSVPARLIP